MTQPVMPGTNRLSVSQAARLLGVSVSSLRAWAAAGMVPHVRTPGGHRRFDRDELAGWLAERGGELPDAPSGRHGTLVAGRMQPCPGASDLLATRQPQVVDDAMALMADGRRLSHRRSQQRRARMELQMAELVDALATGDLSACLREAEWQAYRHGAAGMPATQPVGEALALGRAVERTLVAQGCPGPEMAAVRDAVDRIMWHAAEGLAQGRRSRHEVRGGVDRAA